MNDIPNTAEFEINPSRLKYILELYGLSNDEFIVLLNKGLENELLNAEKLNEILEKKTKINVRVLKKIDKLFKRGLTWYLSERVLPERKSSSIFFRKDSFNSELNFESKKRIEYYEKLKFELQSLCKQINFKHGQILKKYALTDKPESAAKDILTIFNELEKKLIETKYIEKATDDRGYLKNLIGIIEQLNIFIFEFVDRNRRIDKSICFNGFFMLPNIIVIKRQKHFRREIFTVLHELAHYLLSFEEVDENVELNNSENLSNIEQWCNTFAYSFLITGFEKEFSNLTYASKDNDFYKDEIKGICDRTHLSEFALYTRLKIENKISKSDYERIKNDLINNIRKNEQEEKRLLERKIVLAKEQGKELFIQGPKEIKSKLFEEIVKTNYFEGNISESELREHLKISPKKSIEEVIY